METQSPAIQRFTAAWQHGDDDVINRITIEITQSGNDADIVAMSRAMAAIPYGGSQ